ncbi:MAG TPA: hypothetical protein VK585_15520, partial [Jiangellaceae bacterium]|nr:hypothetical protein [Jiangellaceae bacterium]
AEIWDPATTTFGDAGSLEGVRMPDGTATILVKRQPAGFRFYAWASVISGGRIVATDFAPDVGWIEKGE